MKYKDVLTEFNYFIFQNLLTLITFTLSEWLFVWFQRYTENMEHISTLDQPQCYLTWQLLQLLTSLAGNSCIFLVSWIKLTALWGVKPILCHGSAYRWSMTHISGAHHHWLSFCWWNSASQLHMTREDLFTSDLPYGAPWFAIWQTLKVGQTCKLFVSL